MSPTSRIDSKTLNWYIQNGFKLFPIRIDTDESIPLEKRNKRPAVKKWQDADPTRLQVGHWARMGVNLGAVVPRGVLVVDIDPRNGGSVEKVAPLFNGTPLEQFPMVVTGSGGYHIYARLPEGAHDLTKRQNALDGVDLLCNQKAYVLTAGCLHGSGKHYEFSPGCPLDLDELPLAPPNIVALLKRRDGATTQPTTGPGSAPNDQCNPTAPQSGAGALLYMTPEELRDALSQLNAQNFADRDKWFALLCASHEATGGDEIAREMFIAWSTTDPEYADDDEIISTQWDALKVDRPARYTRKTLAKYLRDVGAQLPSTYTRRERLTDYQAASLTTTPESPSELESALDKRDGRFKALVELIDKTSPDELYERFDALAAQTEEFSILQRGRIEYLLRHALKGLLSTRAIEKAFRVVERDADEARKAQKQAAATTKNANKDIPLEIALAFLAELERKKRKLVHHRNGQFYFYDRTQWGSQADHVVKSALAKFATPYLDESEDEKAASTVLAQAFVMTSAYSVLEHDPFNFAERPRSIINCESGELHIDPKTGVARHRPHDPESYQLHKSPVSYDPFAECPAMDSTLEDIFSKAEDPQSLIDFFWELAGYSLQPTKNLPVFPLFIGRGSNGKSLLQDVLKALHGPETVVSKDLALFGDAAKNNHVFAELVGCRLLLDDDLQKGIHLPTSTVKKLSESKLLTANPKGKDVFNFVHHALMIVNANVFPKLKEHTEGIMRRLYPIPFDRKFAKGERDETRAEYIIDNELSGVLNRALEGLERLRRRGDFARPVDVERALSQWVKSGNPAVEFLRTCVDEVIGGSADLGDVWKAYRSWCSDNGVDRVMTKPQLIGLLDEMEMSPTTVDGARVIDGYTLTWSSDDALEGY